MTPALSDQVLLKLTDVSVSNLRYCCRTFSSCCAPASTSCGPASRRRAVVPQASCTSRTTTSAKSTTAWNRDRRVLPFLFAHVSDNHDQKFGATIHACIGIHVCSDSGGNPCHCFHLSVFAVRQNPFCTIIVSPPACLLPLCTPCC